MAVLQKLDLTSMEYWDLADNTFKIAIIKKFKELWESSERQFNELRNQVYWQKEHFTKMLKLQKKNQTNSGVEELNN